jgi:solute carrier family 45 protein 1/2/4
LVNIVCSIGLPFLVSESGVQAQTNQYESLNGSTGHEEPPRSALWKRAQEDIASGGMLSRSVAWVKSKFEAWREGETILPIKGFTLVRLWWISQFVFAGAMAATW